VTFWNAKMARTYETALEPEARAAVVQYLARGRPSFLPRYTVRGYEEIVVGESPTHARPAVTITSGKGADAFGAAAFMAAAVWRSSGGLHRRQILSGSDVIAGVAMGTRACVVGPGLPWWMRCRGRRRRRAKQAPSA
jgi:hypothetical protein